MRGSGILVDLKKIYHGTLSWLPSNATATRLITVFEFQQDPEAFAKNESEMNVQL